MTPDGRNAYVANCNDGQIAQYDIGADGKLTPKTPFTIAAGACPTGMGLTPDGHSFYVAISSP